MSNVQGFDELNVTLGEMLSRSAATRPVLLEIAQKQVSSFQQNFREGGRPEKWKESKRAKKEGGQTLLKSGRLMKSITIPEVTDTSITFGSNLPYAAIHQFGGTINRKPRTLLLKRSVDKETGNEKVRFMSFRAAARRKRGSVEFRRTGNYSITMPARPYIVFQPQDVEDAGKILLRHMLAR
jgi:phage virion morphogenesis protein